MNDKNEMRWQLDRTSSNPQLILHLKPIGAGVFVPYNRSPHGLPDYKIPNGSKGWATFQALMKQGWVLANTPRDELGEAL